MRRAKISVRTAWRANWLIEFGIALFALAVLTREMILAVVGAGILLGLANLSFLFHQTLGILQRELHVVERLRKARVFLGDSIEGELTIRNESRLAARILAIRPIVEKGLSFKLSSSCNQLLRPSTASSVKFEIIPLETGHFRISGFTLAFTDVRGLFTGEATYSQADKIQVYPEMVTRTQLTPLRLYGGGLGIFRRAPIGTDFAGIREYMPGDEYHKVEWKATARLRTLMVKESSSEEQGALQILIDAGGTMNEQSYAGTRLDEALAVARLLTESAVGSGNWVGIWVYDETEIVAASKSATPEEQLVLLRKLAFDLRTGARSKEQPAHLSPSRALRRTPDFPYHDRVTAFIRLLRLRLGLRYRRTGIHRALTEAVATGLKTVLIVLTDLQTNIDALLEAAQTWPESDRIVVAQMGAAWRFAFDLEEAYAQYENNSRIRQHLHHFGLATFDCRPDISVETIAQHIGRSIVH